MGVVLNPVSYRIGFSVSWSDACFVHRMYYSVFLHKLLSIRFFIEYLLYKFFPGYWSDWLYSHCDILKVKDYIYINVFIYDGSEEYKYRRRSAFLLKYFFGKLWLSKFWVKQYLVDWNKKAQKFYLLLQAVGFTVDAKPLEDLTLTVSKRNQRKIKHLKKKKGRIWKAREELYALKLLALFLQWKGYSKFIVKFLPKYYKRLLKKKLNNLVIIEAYKRAFLAIGFIDSVFRFHNFTYPGKNWRFQVLIRLLKVVNCLFFFKPFFSQVAKFIEWVLIYCDVKSYVKFFTIDNTCLTASFIAKYIATSIKKGYHYQHVYRPICKSLDKQLRVRYIGRLKTYKHYYVDKYLKVFNNRENSILYSFSKKVMVVLLRKINSFLNYNYLIEEIGLQLIKVKYFFNKRMSNRIKIRDISLKWKLKLKRRRYINTRFQDVTTFIIKYRTKTSGFFSSFKEIFFVNSFFFKKNLFLKTNKGIKLNYYKFRKFYFVVVKYSMYFVTRKKAVRYIRNIKKHLIKYKNTIYLFKKIFFLKIILYCFRFARFFLNNLEIYFFFRRNFVNFRLFVFKYVQKDFKKLVYVVNLLLLRYIANCNLHIIYFFCNQIYIKGFSYRLLKMLNKSFVSINKKEEKKIQKKNSPLRSKNTSIEYISKKTDLLYGYKFHFVGRFTRKQRAANMWFVKGALFKSTRNVYLDYGWQIAVLQFSVCTVKVWLTKSIKSPVYVLKLN